MQSLVFDTWDTVQVALAALSEQGIEVEPLRRHGGADES